MVRVFMKIFCNPVWKSGLSIVRVLSLNNKEGTFYGPTHFMQFRGYPKENKFLNKLYKHADEIINKTEEITGLKLVK